VEQTSEISNFYIGGWVFGNPTGLVLRGIADCRRPAILLQHPSCWNGYQYVFHIMYYSRTKRQQYRYGLTRLS
jgi:hypothetical protein